MRCWLFKLFLSLCILAQACPISGPMLLYDDQVNQYEVWIETKPGSEPTFLWHSSDTLLAGIPDANFPEILRFRLPDWQANTVYQYLIKSATCNSDTFSFRTFADKQIRSFKACAFSCLKLESNESIALLDSIWRVQPDLLIWLGDNLYLNAADYAFPEAMRAKFQKQRNHPQIKKLMASIPSIAIRDDHDFGPNNADSSFVFRTQSNQLFNSYFRTHSQMERSNTFDIFDVYSLGSWTFFLLDNRSHRQPQKSKQTYVLGKEQINSVRRKITENQHDQFCILSGGQILNSHSAYENLSCYPSEYKQLLSILTECKRPLLLLSGDRHHAEVSVMESITEITTSPIHSTLHKTKENNKYRISKPIDEVNFLLLQFSSSELSFVFQTKKGKKNAGLIRY